MNFRSGLFAAAAALMSLALASCGGGEAPSSPVTNPTTPPTPTPAPIPPPSATTFSVVGVGAAVGSVDFYPPDSANPSGGSSTTPAGEFGRNTAVPANRIYGEVPVNPTVRLVTGLARDTVTGFQVSMMAAPAGATVISPLSAVIAAHGFQSSVRAALDMGTGPDSIQNSLDVLAFNPAQNLRNSNAGIAHDAARLTSINLQLLALASLLKDSTGDPVEVGGNVERSSQYLAELIRETGSVRLQEKSVILALLKKSARKSHGEQNLDRIAALASSYFSTVPTLIDDSDIARAWFYAFQFDILAEIKSTRIQKFSRDLTDPAVIRQSFAYFLASQPPIVFGDFFALPDYRELGSDLVTSRNYRMTMNGCVDLAPLPDCNDVIDPTKFAPSGGRPTTKVVSVSPIDTHILSATVNSDGTIDIARVNNFLGITYFNYTIRLSNGLESSSRVYVRITESLHP
jgi:hypothetical protein